MISLILHPFYHTLDQCGGCFLLLLADGKIGDVTADGRITRRYEIYHRIIAFTHHRNGIKIDGGGQHHSILVIGVVATDFRSAGGAIYFYILITEKLYIFLDCITISFTLSIDHICFFAIDVFQNRIERVVLKLIEQ